LVDRSTERRKLGRELRKARQAAGLTQSAVAKALRCGQAKINKIETTLVDVDPGELDTLLQAYQVSEDKAKTLRHLAARSRRVRRRLHPTLRSPEFAHLTDFEMDATELLCLHGERLPGPLQSELYMLRQFDAHTAAHEDVVELMRQQQTRAEIFDAEHPPRYRVILSEAFLYRMPGGQRYEVIVDQIEYLLKLIGTYDSLEVSLLPFGVDVPFVGTDFVLARFDGRERDFAYLEYPGGATLVKARDRLAALVEHWQELHQAALDRSASATFLRQFAEQTRHQWITRGNDEPPIMSMARRPR